MLSGKLRRSKKMKETIKNLIIGMLILGAFLVQANPCLGLFFKKRPLKPIVEEVEAIRVRNYGKHQLTDYYLSKRHKALWDYQERRYEEKQVDTYSMAWIKRSSYKSYPEDPFYALIRNLEKRYFSNIYASPEGEILFRMFLDAKKIMRSKKWRQNGARENALQFIKAVKAHERAYTGLLKRENSWESFDKAMLQTELANEGNLDQKKKEMYKNLQERELEKSFQTE